MRHSLSSSHYTFTEANTIGGITFSRDINPTPLFQLGAIGVGKIEFEILDLDKDILSNRVILPLRFADGSYLTLRDGTKVGLYDHTESVSITGTEFEFSRNDRRVGYFTATEVVKDNDTRIKVVAYDRLSRFDKIADTWWNAQSFPQTIGQLLISLCQFVDMPFVATSALNLDKTITQGFHPDNTPAKDFLSWICEITGTYAICNEDGVLVLDYYHPSDIHISLSNTQGTQVEEYALDVITGLQIRAKENDIGVIVGSGANSYVIESNPLLYDLPSGDIESIATAILNRVQNVTYVPAKVNLIRSLTADIKPLVFQDGSYLTLSDGTKVGLADEYIETPDVRIGDIITVQTQRETVTMYVQSEIVNGYKAEIASVGAKSRVQVQSVNKSIKQLKGKQAELIQTVDELSATLTDFEEQTESQFRQTASEIQTKVSQTDFNGNTVASLINQTATTIAIEAEKLDLSGYVTISALGTAGETVINGSNITTGYINADRIRGGTIDGDTITVRNLSADSITTGTLNGQTVDMTNINASNITSGILNGNTIPLTNLNANNISNGTLSTSRVNASTMSGHLSTGTGYLTSRTGTFSGVVQWSNGSITNSGAGTVMESPYQQVYRSGLMHLFTGANVNIQQGLSVNKDATVDGSLRTRNLSVTGSKNALVSTPSYGDRLINAYETAEYYFGDIGSNRVRDGECVVVLDPIFMECVNTDIEYQVFLTPYGDGHIYVKYRDYDRFTVVGDNIPFGWEIKAKRKNYEYVRLKEVV